MSDVDQMTAGAAGNEATIAAMADILSAIGNGGGIMEWADEAPVTAARAGSPVAASGATIGHGAIRLRDSAPPALDAVEGIPPVAAARAVVGHGTIRLRGRAATQPAPEAGIAAPDEAVQPVGHGPIRLREAAGGPERADLTPSAAAAIQAVLDATS